MLGLPRGNVFLQPWTSEWEREFEQERLRIESEIGGLVIDIHHIGSTAVRGLSAKPILDIGIELKDFGDGPACVQGLARLGYDYKGTNILPDRHYWNKGEPRTHQIHMYQAGNVYLRRQLAFRDYLSAHPAALMEYQALKERLVLEHSSDKFAYTEAKTKFVHSILAKAGLDVET